MSKPTRASKSAKRPSDLRKLSRKRHTEHVSRREKRQRVRAGAEPPTKGKTLPNNADANTASEWKARHLKDELTGDLTLEFSFPVGDGTTGKLEIDSALAGRDMVLQLRRKTRVLPQDLNTAIGLVSNVIDGAPVGSVLKSHQPGWKPLPVMDGSSAKSSSVKFEQLTAFVTPGQIVGPKADQYVWLEQQGGGRRIGVTAGSPRSWHKSVGADAKRSNYIAFAIGAALASPVRRFSDLEEDPVFNIVGSSSVGKTTCVKAGMSAIGHPRAIHSWDKTERELEEAAAAHNDLLLVLNAAERTTPSRRATMLNRVVHMLPDGESTLRPSAIQATYPNLTWTGITLSTSNKTGPEMAADLHVAWDPQDSVRFIDIPVPPDTEGGIFDRLDTRGLARRAEARQLIKDLEKALRTNYGVLLRPWIEYLLQNDPTRTIRRLIDRFLRKLRVKGGKEERIARKFALIYAALGMAVDAGILQWPKSLPFQAVSKLYQRARAARTGSEQGLDSALKELRDALDDDSAFPYAKPGVAITVPDGSTFRGVRYHGNGPEVVGMRLEDLHATFERATVRKLIEHFKSSGALLDGHKDKMTRQLTMTLSVAGTTTTKPRFLVFDAAKLQDALKAR